MTIINTQA